MTKPKLRYILIFLLAGFLCAQNISDQPASAITASSIEITLGTAPSLTLAPGAFGSVAQSIEVMTDNYTGYTLNLTNSSNSTALINSDDNTLTIPTITLTGEATSLTESTFGNGYGLSLNGTDFVPAPSSSAALQIGSTSASGTVTHSLTFAAKPASDTPSGSYSKTFVIAAVVNDPQYSVTYDENISGTVSNMPTDVSVTTSSTGSIELSSSEPTRTGYVFLGWDEDDTVTSNPTYQPGDIITLEPTQANAIELYAIWEERQGGGDWTEPEIDDSATVYDPDNVPANSVIKYESVPGQPQVATDSSGNITRFEYTDIDSNTGLSLTSELDTGVLAFDGTGFTIVLRGSFPWTTETRSPIISLSGLVNNAASGLVVNTFKPSGLQRYTNTSGTRMTSAATINRFRCFQYSGGSLSNAYNIIYNNPSNTSSETINGLGWLQTEAPLTATIVVEGTVSGSNTIIDVKVYNSYDAETGTGTLIGVLPNSYTYSIAGLESSGITVELGYYALSDEQSLSYSFTVYEFSVTKN